MSNYPNMSYCMNENTLAAMRQVVDAMRNEGVDFLREMSREERRAFEELFYTCGDFMNLAEELQDGIEQEQDDTYDDYMDGDPDSALASADWGTDEDYGG